MIYDATGANSDAPSMQPKTTAAERLEGERCGAQLDGQPCYLEPWHEEEGMGHCQAPTALIKAVQAEAVALRGERDAAVQVSVDDNEALQEVVAERDAATGLLQLWADALYECQAGTCEAGEKMHLRNFDAARPTLAFLSDKED